MKSSKIIWIIIALFLAFICAAAAYAYWIKEARTSNKISTGKLSGKIIQEYEGEDIPKLAPGEKTSNKVYIQNTGSEECFARMKVEAYWADQDGILQEDHYFQTEDIEIGYFDTGENARWIMKEDAWGTVWYYYRGILSPGERTEDPLVEWIGLSESAGDLYGGVYGKMDIAMECIQTTGGSLKEMWNINTGELGTGEPSDRNEGGESKVVFQDSERGFTYDMDQESIFLRWESAMPGESFSQIVHLGNNWGQAVSMYMYGSFTEDNLTQENKEQVIRLLKEHVDLKITGAGGKVLYEGKVWDESFRKGSTDKILLGTIQPGESAAACVTLSVSPEIENEYQGLEGGLDWIFTAQSEDRDEDLGKIAISPQGDGPQTGDDIVWIRLFVCAVLSFAAAMILFARRKKV